jgi:hypothetical protein
MVPTLVRESFHRDGWLFEEKVDGWRIIAYKDGHRVRLLSRRGVDYTKRFDGIAAAITKLSARTMVLDCEMPCTDSSSDPASSCSERGAPDAVATPPVRRDSREGPARLRTALFQSAAPARVERRHEFARGGRKEASSVPDDGNSTAHLPAARLDRGERGGTELTFDSESATAGHAIALSHCKLHRFPVR